LVTACFVATIFAEASTAGVFLSTVSSDFAPSSVPSNAAVAPAPGVVAVGNGSTDAPSNAAAVAATPDASNNGTPDPSPGPPLSHRIPTSASTNITRLSADVTTNLKLQPGAEELRCWTVEEETDTLDNEALGCGHGEEVGGGGGVVEMVW
jgi:hypothetical protein